MKLSTKFNKQIVIVAALVFGGAFAFGQDGENLVPNGSFEELTKKPKKTGSIELATGWVSPTGYRADLYTEGNSNVQISTPDNMHGKESAKDGDNYAGFVAYSRESGIYRSYIMGKLDAPLKKGMTYCVKFYVSLSESSKYAVNNVGVVLSKKQFGTDDKVPIIEEPSLMHFNNDTKILSARYEWTEICGTFVADGNEKYITIGNFVSDGETNNERMKKDDKIKVELVGAAYYYVDNISVQLLDTERGETCECAIEDAGEQYSKTVYQKVYSINDDMTPTEKIEIQQVYFAFGSSKLTSEGETSLNLIAEWLKANPELRLQINGHCNAKEDEVGEENDYYADMDNKRIAAVMEYLTSKGIDSSRLMASQKGSEVGNPEIMEDDDDDLKMAKDRRVTFKVR